MNTNPQAGDLNSAISESSASAAIEASEDSSATIASLAREVDELRQQLNSRVLETDLLLQVIENVNAGLTLEEVLNHVFDSFNVLIPYDRIGFALVEDGGTSARAIWARSKSNQSGIEAGYSAPLENSSLGRLLELRRPRILNNLAGYLLAHPASESTRRIVEEGMLSSLTCPLYAMDKPIGFVFFSSMRADTYEHAHVELFMSIAGQLATAVEKGRLYQELLELNKLKSRFLGIAVHDLRNPIGIVQGYLNLFLHGFLGEVPERQLHLMERMDLACRGMLSLINDLLDISAIESGHLQLQPELTNIADLIQESCEGNRILAEAKTMTLDVVLAPDLPQMQLDPNRIQQVLGNLITNAIKYSYPGTTITVRASRVDDEVQIAVEDQGQGIPDEDLPKIFADFGRASTRPTGGEKSVGLGLAIVKRIARAHGGRVWVKSKVGEGSIFTFSLPIRQDALQGVVAET